MLAETASMSFKFLDIPIDLLLILSLKFDAFRETLSSAVKHLLKNWPVRDGT